MVSKKKEIQKELGELINLGRQLYAKLVLESGKISFDDPPLEQEEDESDEDYEEYLEGNSDQKKLAAEYRELAKGIRDFSSGYEHFYTLALTVVQALAPDRYPDFVSHYKNDRRKEVHAGDYLISDAVIGRSSSYKNFGPATALPRVWSQIGILEAISANLDKVLNDIDTLIRADLFDSEIDAARHLLSRGHVRAAGAIAGVVLETHLGVVAERHGFKSRKKNPTIADFNEHLKSEGVIDVVFWRRIQSYADIRNSCDHRRETDPITQDVEDLLRGVTRVIKEVG